MGCWNKTCGLTNLHIKAGDKAYVFVLEKRDDDNDGHCYSTHLYKPLLLPFETTYNDYGGGEDSTGPGFPFIMDGIKRCLHEVEPGDNQYHDIAVKKDEFNEELFFEAVHEGRLFREGNFSSPVKLEYVMFRKDIVDDILENRVIEKYVGSGKGTGGYDNNYVYYKFADIVADILPMLQEIVEMSIKAKETGNDYKLFGGLEYMFEYDHPNLAAKWLRGGDSYRFSRIVDMNRVLTAVLTGDDVEASVLKLEALITEELKGRFIDSLMEVTRRSWIPQSGEGSQCAENDEYRLINAAMARAMDAEDAYYRELNGEEA